VPFLARHPALPIALTRQKAAALPRHRIPNGATSGLADTANVSDDGAIRGAESSPSGGAAWREGKDIWRTAS